MKLTPVHFVFLFFAILFLGFFVVMMVISMFHTQTCYAGQCWSP